MIESKEFVHTVQIGKCLATTGQQPSRALTPLPVQWVITSSRNWCLERLNTSIAPASTIWGEICKLAIATFMEVGHKWDSIALGRRSDAMRVELLVMIEVCAFALTMNVHLGYKELWQVLRGMHTKCEVMRNPLRRRKIWPCCTSWELCTKFSMLNFS